MVKFTDIIYNEYVKKYGGYALIGLVSTIFAITGIYCLYKYYFNNIDRENRNKVDIPNANSQTNTIYLYFFNANWCPHCTTAKPEWIDFVNAHDGSVVNGKTIQCVGGINGTDCTDTDDAAVQEKIQTFGIDHYPTIKLVKDDVVIDYDAKITNDNLYKFIQTVA